MTASGCAARSGFGCKPKIRPFWHIKWLHTIPLNKPSKHGTLLKKNLFHSKKPFRVRHSNNLKNIWCWLVGCVLVVCWLCVGCVLVVCWSCVGRVLVVCWSCVGRVLVVCWSCVGCVLFFVTAEPGGVPAKFRNHIATESVDEGHSVVHRAEIIISSHDNSLRGLQDAEAEDHLLRTRRHGDLHVLHLLVVGCTWHHGTPRLSQPCCSVKWLAWG